MHLNDINENDVQVMLLGSTPQHQIGTTRRNLLEWIELAQARIKELEADTTISDFNEGHDDGWQVGYDACLEKHEIEEDDE